MMQKHGRHERKLEIAENYASCKPNGKRQRRNKSFRCYTKIMWIALYVILAMNLHISPIQAASSNNRNNLRDDHEQQPKSHPILEWIKGEDNYLFFGIGSSTGGGSRKDKKTLSFLEISEMRVRDIKRRLAREHGYAADEIAKMIDKKDLINALSYEEHRVEQKETERKKRVALKRSILVALFCVIVVMFHPLLVHAWEILLVNVQVYTDKKRYEWSRIYDFRSGKAAIGFLMILCIHGLQLWLSLSVILSWITPSSAKKHVEGYLFPVPYIPIRPAALIATATGNGGGNGGGAGPLANYGINIGPMLTSWFLQYVTGKVEMYMGKALSEAHHRQKQEKRAAKRQRREKEVREAMSRKKEAFPNMNSMDSTSSASTEQRRETWKVKNKNNSSSNSNNNNNTNNMTEIHPDSPAHDHECNNYPLYNDKTHHRHRHHMPDEFKQDDQHQQQQPQPTHGMEKEREEQTTTKQQSKETKMDGQRSHDITFERTHTIHSNGNRSSVAPSNHQYGAMDELD